MFTDSKIPKRHWNNRSSRRLSSSDYYFSLVTFQPTDMIITYKSTNNNIVSTVVTFCFVVFNLIDPLFSLLLSHPMKENKCLDNINNEKNTIAFAITKRRKKKKPDKIPGTDMLLSSTKAQTDKFGSVCKKKNLFFSYQKVSVQKIVYLNSQCRWWSLVDYCRCILCMLMLFYMLTMNHYLFRSNSISNFHKS